MIKTNYNLDLWEGRIDDIIKAITLSSVKKLISKSTSDVDIILDIQSDLKRHFAISADGRINRAKPCQRRKLHTYEYGEVTLLDGSTQKVRRPIIPYYSLDDVNAKEWKNLLKKLESDTYGLDSKDLFSEAYLGFLEGLSETPYIAFHSAMVMDEVWTLYDSVRLAFKAVHAYIYRLRRDVRNEDIFLASEDEDKPQIVNPKIEAKAEAEGQTQTFLVDTLESYYREDNTKVTICLLLADGYTVQTIADYIGYSKRTTERLIAKIKADLGLQKVLKENTK